ncbi:FKBP-type peptidyl-prolyl cis-trans isomerase [Agromyces neolithicus]|uniref:Peptidyl-prolyl cis-trans isomerase n=1 Tax=Agromyces neolithicus TaxID=269420 RepID=A0ABN2MCS5_9MICO
MRSSLALIATAGAVVIALTGCTAPAPAPVASPGDSSDAVVVTGDFGSEPRVEFPTPLAPPETQCTEVIAGEGDYLQEGQFVLLGASLFDGTTGEQVQAVGYDEPAQLVLGDGTLPAFTHGLSCAREGSRVVVVAPSEEVGGEEGQGSLVAVFDVQRAFPLRADGSVRLTRDGFPAVVLAPDGRPGITVPEADPFENTEVEVLKQGNGQVVEDGDSVVVHYTGVVWETGKVFDSSWETKEEDNPTPGPRTFVVGEGGEVVPGFSDAIVGQKVGSQVGVVVAPVDGYGDQASGDIPANATLFFVIDILGVI